MIFSSEPTARFTRREAAQDRISAKAAGVFDRGQISGKEMLALWPNVGVSPR
jgi:hypothetical protein